MFLRVCEDAWVFRKSHILVKHESKKKERKQTVSEKEQRDKQTLFLLPLLWIHA